MSRRIKTSTAGGRRTVLRDVLPMNDDVGVSVSSRWTCVTRRLESPRENFEKICGLTRLAQKLLLIGMQIVAILEMVKASG
jgi:hypothetical protein